jgi:medium-chain acyl-[acyl-carrier-protein] hydrolase
MMSGMATNSTWITRPKPNAQASLRLFCFPYAGGSPVIFRQWTDILPPEIEVCCIQPPGRGARLNEQSFTQLPPLIEALFPALLEHLDKPFAFFGHSMGALISFEIARRLSSESGPAPSHLFLSGRRAPQLIDTQPPTHSLPEPEFIAKVTKLNGTPREVLEHPELMRLMIPILRADFAVCETYAYVHGPPLACPISVFGGLQDSEVSREDLAAWREQTNSAAFSLKMLPGDHFFLHTSMRLLIETIYRELLMMRDGLGKP